MSDFNKKQVYDLYRKMDELANQTGGDVNEKLYVEMLELIEEYKVTVPTNIIIEYEKIMTEYVIPTVYLRQSSYLIDRNLDNLAEAFDEIKDSVVKKYIMAND